MLEKERGFSKYIRNQVESPSHQKQTDFHSYLDPVFVVDRDFKLIFANQSLANILDLDLSQILGRQCCQVIHGQPEPPSYCPHDKVLSNGTGAWFESWEPLFKGRFRFEVTSMVDKDGALRGAVHVGRPLEDKTPAEDEAAAEIKLLRQTFQAVQEGLTVLSNDLTILRANRMIEDWYAGRAPLLGKKCYEVFHDRDTPLPDCPALEVLRTGRPQTKIMQRLDKGQPAGWLEISVHPMMDQSGHRTGMVESLRDITDLVQAGGMGQADKPGARPIWPQPESKHKFVVICSHCKKVRDEKGHWIDFEDYFSRHALLEFSHGLCAECINEIYPELSLEFKRKPPVD